MQGTPRLVLVIIISAPTVGIDIVGSWTKEHFLFDFEWPTKAAIVVSRVWWLAIEINRQNK